MEGIVGVDKSRGPWTVAERKRKMHMCPRGQIWLPFHSSRMDFGFWNSASLQWDCTVFGGLPSVKLQVYTFTLLSSCVVH